jgi:hypothetical protein
MRHSSSIKNMLAFQLYLNAHITILGCITKKQCQFIAPYTPLLLTNNSQVISSISGKQPGSQKLQRNGLFRKVCVIK